MKARSAAAHKAVLVRPAMPQDLDDVTAIDAVHTGRAKLDHWNKALAQARSDDHLFLVACQGSKVAGFLVGEIRAWEFGSGPAGWVHAVAVLPDSQSHGIGGLLVQEARSWFRTRGVTSVRTMVDRSRVDLLRFFRGAGFAAGSYVEMEVIEDGR